MITQHIFTKKSKLQSAEKVSSLGLLNVLGPKQRRDVCTNSLLHIGIIVYPKFVI